MAVTELFSQRRARELGQGIDVFVYDKIPDKLRNQIVFLMRDVLGAPDAPSTIEYYTYVYQKICREFGKQSLVKSSWGWPGKDLIAWFTATNDEVRAIDATEIIMSTIHLIGLTATSNKRREEVEEAIEEFNTRCKQNAVGFQFDGGQLIRMDSQALHAEVVKPALMVLTDPVFANADAEFRNAHKHWVDGNYPEVLVDCLKAFESTMKIIASERQWATPDKPTASQLVKVMFDNNLIPAFYATQMAGLRSVLESGIPTPRNRAGGHGAGAGPAAPVPEELVKYVLHLTAATILFLVDAHKARP